MSDLVKDAAIALFSLVFVSGVVHDRAREAVRRDARAYMRGGTVSVRVRPLGDLGLLVGQASEVSIRAEGVQVDAMPLHIERAHGVVARSRILRVDLHRSTVRGMPLTRFRAEIPSVSLDMARAFWDQRVVLRGAKPGRVEAAVDADDIGAFIARKYPSFSGVGVRLADGLIRVDVTATVLGMQTHITAEGRPTVRDGRYLEIDAPIVRVNDRLLDADAAKAAMSAFSPLLDVDRDLGMAELVRLDAVVVADGLLTVRGSITVPENTRGRG